MQLYDKHVSLKFPAINYLIKKSIICQCWENRHSLLILSKQFVLGLWCLTPLSSNIPVLLVEDRSTSRKPPTCRKLFVKWYNCEYLIKKCTDKKKGNRNVLRHRIHHKLYVLTQTCCWKAYLVEKIEPKYLKKKSFVFCS
jgi:hypothetical protein